MKADDRRVRLVGGLSIALCVLAVAMALSAPFLGAPVTVGIAGLITAVFAMVLIVRILMGRHFPAGAVVVSRPWKWVALTGVVILVSFMIVSQLSTDPTQIARPSLYPALLAWSLRVLVERAPAGKPVSDDRGRRRQ